MGILCYEESDRSRETFGHLSHDVMRRWLLNGDRLHAVPFAEACVISGPCMSPFPPSVGWRAGRVVLYSFAACACS